MFALVVVVAVVALIMLSSSAASRKARRFLALETKGLRGRALVLSCVQLGSGVTLNGRRFEKRTMTLDVEIPGREPYVSTGDFLMPRGVAETIPGTSLDIAVDPRNQNQILVLGPGGLSGPWIRIGPPRALLTSIWADSFAAWLSLRTSRPISSLRTSSQRTVEINRSPLTRTSASRPCGSASSSPVIYR